MLNLYAITRDQIRPTRYYEYAENPFAACDQFREYWNRPKEALKFTLIAKNVQKPLGAK
jgi:hypothetical protein